MAKIWYKKDPYLLDSDVLFDLVDKNGLESYGLLVLLFDEMAKKEDRLITSITVRKIKKQYSVSQDLMDEVLSCEVFYKLGDAYGCDVVDEAVKAFDRAVEKSKDAAEKRWIKHKLKQDNDLCSSITQAMPKQCPSNADKIRKDEIRKEKKRKEQTIKDGAAYDANICGDYAAKKTPQFSNSFYANSHQQKEDPDDLPF